MSEKTKLPTLSELIDDTELSLKENALMVLLNQEPPKAWISYHPIIKVKDAAGNSVPYPYLAINRIEYLLSRIFGKWWVEILSVNCIANSTVVVVRLFVVNPITGLTEHQDGVGAAPIQTDSGAGAMDWNKAKSAGVQMSAPAAETLAVKDAAEKFGKLFGKDLARRDVISYDTLLKVSNKEEKENERIVLLINDCKSLAELEKLRQYVGGSDAAVADAFADKLETFNK